VKVRPQSVTNGAEWSTKTGLDQVKFGAAASAAELAPANNASTRRIARR
jgi:hypothetical protein